MNEKKVFLRKILFHKCPIKIRKFPNFAYIFSKNYRPFLVVFEHLHIFCQHELNDITPGPIITMKKSKKFLQNFHFFHFCLKFFDQSEGRIFGKKKPEAVELGSHSYFNSMNIAPGLIIF